MKSSNPPTPGRERAGSPLLRRLPGSRREPAGFEWWLLRRLPRYTLLGTLIPLAVYAVAWFLTGPEPTQKAAKELTDVGIAAVAVVLTLWTAVFTAAIGCCIVWLMKGPGFVADAYPLSDAAEPRTRRSPDS